MSSAEKPAEEAAPAPSGSKLPFLLGLLNAVAVLAAAGMLFYTRIIFKRPAITEDGERARLAARHVAAPVNPAAGTMTFEPITVNIEPTPANPADDPDSPAQMRGKLHYATLGFVLELRDIDNKGAIDELKPRILDRLLSLMGRKSFSDLASVQGRYLLRTQIAEIVNQLVGGRSHEPASEGMPRESIVTNVYFTQFIVQ